MTTPTKTYLILSRRELLAMLKVCGKEMQNTVSIDSQISLNPETVIDDKVQINSGLHMVVSGERGEYHCGSIKLHN